MGGEHAAAADDHIHRITDHSILIDITLALMSRLHVDAICTTILHILERTFAADACWVQLRDPLSDRLVTVEGRGDGSDVYAEISATDEIVGMAFSTGEPVLVPETPADEPWCDPPQAPGTSPCSILTVPLFCDSGRIGVFGFHSRRFRPDQVPPHAQWNLLMGLGALASVAIRNARAMEEVAPGCDQQGAETRPRPRSSAASTRRRNRTSAWPLQATDGLIGRSDALRDMLEQAETVAPADTTVLLLGETGTGKELLARAIHDASSRNREIFLAVNCAALPLTLLESELFGHEKGAFTGAVERRPGRFEVADGGTLFLDEIGELPLEAQAKLLRVLEDQQVLRVGGTRPVPVNVRVIAATNRDLVTSMSTGTFRADLFYRLSVFPISLPPLRQRREDIPLLVTHFLEEFAARLGRGQPLVASQALEKLSAYGWPGNVRELQNVVERAVLLANGGEISSEMVATSERLPDLATTARVETDPAPRAIATAPRLAVPLAEAERHAITEALKACGWRISGPRGAALRLGLCPTTLHAKMKKLGVERPRQ